jgi:RNA polymerase sigma factor (sigma-70 family)
MPSDAELVRAARTGLKAPMAELLRRHGDTAVALAARVLDSPDLARDAVQEAAIAAMTDLGRLRSPERFGAWFCGITLNVARRWRRQLRPEVTGLAADRPDMSPGPAEAVETADTAARVRAAIGSLADGQRHAVRLFYLQGLSHQEVAAELGISVGAVKARLHQARTALAPKLSPLSAARQERTLRKEEEGTMSESTGAGAGRAAPKGATGPAEWAAVRVAEVRRTAEDDPRARKHVMILAEEGGDRMLRSGSGQPKRRSSRWRFSRWRRRARSPTSWRPRWSRRLVRASPRCGSPGLTVTCSTRA